MSIDPMTILGIVGLMGYNTYTLDEYYFKCLGDLHFILKIGSWTVSSYFRDMPEHYISVKLTKKKGQSPHISLYIGDYDIITKEKVIGGIVLGYLTTNPSGKFSSCMNYLNYLPTSQTGDAVTIQEYNSHFKLFSSDEMYIDNGQVFIEIFDCKIKCPLVTLKAVLPECRHEVKRDHTFKLTKTFEYAQSVLNINKIAFNDVVEAAVGNYSLCRARLDEINLKRPDAIKLYKILSSRSIVKSHFWDNALKKRVKQFQKAYKDHIEVDSSDELSYSEILLAYTNRSIDKKIKNFNKYLARGTTICVSKKKNLIRFERINIADRKVMRIWSTYSKAHYDINENYQKLLAEFKEFDRVKKLKPITYSQFNPQIREGFETDSMYKHDFNVTKIYEEKSRILEIVEMGLNDYNIALEIDTERKLMEMNDHNVSKIYEEIDKLNEKKIKDKLELRRIKYQKRIDKEEKTQKRREENIKRIIEQDRLRNLKAYEAEKLRMSKLVEYKPINFMHSKNVLQSKLKFKKCAVLARFINVSRLEALMYKMFLKSREKIREHYSKVWWEKKAETDRILEEKKIERARKLDKMRVNSIRRRKRKISKVNDYPLGIKKKHKLNPEHTMDVLRALNNGDASFYINDMFDQYVEDFKKECYEKGKDKDLTSYLLHSEILRKCYTTVMGFEGSGENIPRVIPSDEKITQTANLFFSMEERYGPFSGQRKKLKPTLVVLRTKWKVEHYSQKRMELRDLLTLFKV